MDTAGLSGVAVVVGAEVVGFVVVEGAAAWLELAAAIVVEPLLELPLLNTVLILFTYFPMLCLRSSPFSDPPGPGELMVVVDIENPGRWQNGGL